MNRRSGKNPARKRIGRLMPQLRAAPDLHASRPKPHLATGQRQGHPDEVGPLEARGPTSSKLRAAEKNSEPPKIFSEPPSFFSEPPSFFSEPRKIFSEPPSLGEPFSSFYRNTSEYVFAGTLSHTPAQRLQAAGQHGLLHGNASTHHSSALRIGATTGIFRRTPSHATRRHGSSSRAARPAPQQNLHTRSKSLRINMTLDAPRRAQNPTPHPHGGGQKDRKTPGKAEKK